jgi:serine protease inhibitor ecotin
VDNRRLSISELTRQQNAPSPAAAPASPPSTKAPLPQVKKGPIRMQLPIDDYDDDDGLDVQANKGMSIKDAVARTELAVDNDQDKRSKQWGIDMSRFMND